MKKPALILLTAFILTIFPLYGEDALPLKEGVLAVSVAPAFRIAPKEWDGSRGGLKAISFGLGVEYGINDWFSASLTWMPGVNAWSAIDGGNYGLFGDLSAALQAQIIGPYAVVPKENMRLAVAVETVVPLPSTSGSPSVIPITNAEPDSHLWGTGVQVFYDYVFNTYFFLSGYFEALYYPDQPVENANFGSGYERIHHPLDFLIQVEPHVVFQIKDRAIVLKGSLPISYGLSLATKQKQGAGWAETAGLRHNLSLGPVFTASFSQFRIPFDISLQYRVAVFGKYDFASHDIILSGKIYIPIVDMLTKHKFVPEGVNLD
jgi:hypothetical protein